MRSAVRITILIAITIVTVLTGPVAVVDISPVDIASASHSHDDCTQPGDTDTSWLQGASNHCKSGHQGNDRAVPDSTGPSWHVDLGTTVSEWADPIPNGSVVYVPTNSGIYALNKQDGSIQWSISTESPVVGMAMDSGILYVNTRDTTSGTNSTTYAYYIANQSVKWKHEDTFYNGRFGVPAIDKYRNLLYVSLGEPNDNDNGGGLVAFDLDTGVEQWNFTSFSNQDYSGEPLFVNSTGMVYITDNDLLNEGYNFFAVDASTGNEVWSVNGYASDNGAISTAWSPHHSPNGSVWLGDSLTGTTVRALDASTGSVQMSSGNFNSSMGIIQYSNNAIIGTRPDAIDNEFVTASAINASDGSWLWGGFTSSPAMPGRGSSMGGEFYIQNRDTDESAGVVGFQAVQVNETEAFNAGPEIQWQFEHTVGTVNIVTQDGVAYTGHDSHFYAVGVPFSTAGKRLTYKINTSADINADPTSESGEDDTYRSQGAAIDPTNGHYWLGAGGFGRTNRVDHFDETGSLVGGFQTNGRPRDVSIHDNGASSSGGIWIVYGDFAAEYDTSGTEVTQHNISSTVGTPVGIALDGDEMWILNNSDTVFKFYTNGTYSGTSFEQSAFPNANFMDIGPEHHIWIQNVSHAGRYHKNGTFIQGSSYDFQTHADFDDGDPGGIAVTTGEDNKKGTTARDVWWLVDDGGSLDSLLRKFEEYNIPNFPSRCGQPSNVWGSNGCSNPAISGTGPTDKDSTYIDWQRSDLKPAAEMTLDTSTGTLYVPAGSTLYALNQSTGENKWTKTLAGAAGSPVIVGDEIYVTGNDTIYALNKTDNGSTIWSKSINRSINRRGLDYLNGKLSFAAGEKWAWAINANDGSTVWVEELDSDRRPAKGVHIYEGHQFDGNVSLVVTGDGRFSNLVAYAIWLHNGTRKWTHDYGTGNNKYNPEFPSAHNGTMYIPGSAASGLLGAIAAIDIWRAEPLWDGGAGTAGTAASYEGANDGPYGGNLLYHIYESGGGKVRALSQEYYQDADTLWDVRTGSTVYFDSHSPPAVTEDYVYAFTVTSNDTAVYTWLEVRHRSNGTRHYRLLMSSGGSNDGDEFAPIVNGSTLFFADHMGSVYSVQEDSNDPPTIDNGSATPNDENSPGSDATLEVNVSDPDFSTVGENVTVDIYFEGSLVDTQNITEPTRVSHTVAGLNNSTFYEWHVVATDDSGFTTTSETFTFLNGENKPPSVDNTSASPDGITQESARSTLSIDVSDPNFPADTVTVGFWFDGQLVDAQEIESNQTVETTVFNIQNGSHTWNVSVFDQGGLSDESEVFSFTVLHHAPVIDNSSASPNGTTLDEDTRLKIDVGDLDFLDDTGDVVTVTFIVNGEVAGTDELFSNGTASIQAGILGGTNNWSVIAEDRFGFTTTSKNFTFEAPGNLFVRNETNFTELVQNSSLEFYFDREGTEDDIVVEQDAPNGIGDMTGLPVNEPFVVVASSNDYFNRRIYVTSLFETEDIYLLNESEDAVQPTFDLLDFTGNYPQEDTVLQVQRNINGSWQTVEGDFFGAAGTFSAQLEFNERHRLVVINTITGDQRELGIFTPVTSGTVVVEVHPDDTIIREAELPFIGFNPDARSLPASENVTITVTLSNTTDEFNSFYVRAVLNTSTGAEVLYNVSGFDPTGGTISQDVNLSGYAGRSLTVYANWTTDLGPGSESQTFTIRESFNNQYSILSQIVRMPSRLPSSTAGAFTAFITLIVVALATSYTATRTSTETAAFVGLAFLGGFMMIDWVPFGWFFVATVATFSLAALRRGL